MLSQRDEKFEKVTTHWRSFRDVDKEALVRRARQLAEEVEEIAEAGGTASQEGDCLRRLDMDS